MDRDRAPLGAHMSIAGGVANAVDRAVRADSTALQVFVKNASQWKGKLLTDPEAGAFRNARRQAGLSFVAAHNSYLINLASPDPALRERSVTAFLDELERCWKLGLDILVAHPGAHCGSGEDLGLERIAESLDRVCQQSLVFPVRIALETTAGQGSTLGYRFEHLRDILDLAGHPSRLSVCLDTCHVFAAGYDLRGDYEACWGEFDRIIGLDRLSLLHLNDSKRKLGSRVDRHEHIGKGALGPEVFALLMNDERLRTVPKILETPKGDGETADRENLSLLRSMVGLGRGGLQ